MNFPIYWVNKVRRVENEVLSVGFLRVLIGINSLVPLVLILIDGARGNLGVNPLEFYLRATGSLTLIFLLLTLSVTPFRRLTGSNQIVKHRRMLGLFAFFYAVLHATAYAIFDKGLDASAIAGDVLQRPFISFGMAAFLMILPLALTSTGGWVRRLGGRNWSRLHRLTYLIAILGVIHFWMLVKSDILYPAAAGIALFALLGYRFLHFLYERRRKGVDS